MLRITLHLNKTTCTDEIQTRKLSQKFSKACSNDIGLWLARLDAESGAARPIDSELSAYSPPSHIPEPIHKLWAEARAKAEMRANEEDLLVELWVWGLHQLRKDPLVLVDTWAVGLVALHDVFRVYDPYMQIILRESLSHTSPTLHSQLLLHRLYDNTEDSFSHRATLAKKLVAQYRPSVLFFDLAMGREFQILLSSKSTQDKSHEEQPPRKKQKQDKGAKVLITPSIPKEYQCLEALYTAWRVIPDQGIPAVLKWAKSLYQLGEEEWAEGAIRAAGGSKGRLRQEWEAVRDGARGDNSPEAGGAQSKDDTPGEQDIALDRVEYV